jgi:hypothetical protein
MSHGPLSVFYKTIASAATKSSEFDLARAWKTVYLEIPSMTSNTQIHIQAANESGGTYRRVYHPAVNSSAAQVNVFAITSSVTGCMVPIPNGFRYLKVETTATVDNGATFRMICSD